jgi:hypothetical protein
MQRFGKKNAEAQRVDGDRPKMETTQRERMMALAVITAALVIVAGLTLVATSGGTPLSRCNGILISQQKAECLLALANSTKNASVCSYLTSSLAGRCITNIALLSGNASICDGIPSNSQTYAGCLTGIGTAKHNVSYCGGLGEPYLSTCAYSVASGENFSSILTCSMIGNASLSADCSAKSHYNDAVLLRNATYCSYLPTAYNYSLVSYISQSSARIFGLTNVTSTLAYLNTSPSSYCYYNLARLDYNRSLCGLVTGQLGTLCGYQLSTSASYNISAVNSITLQNVTALCSQAPQVAQAVCSYALYIYIAAAQRNASVCGMIRVAQYQNACYAGIANKYQNSSYCSYIQNSTERIACSVGVPTNST